MNLFDNLAMLYVFVGIITFGRAYVEFDADAKHSKDPPGSSALFGVMAGTAWPLYWSVKLAEANR